jgi:hypothetical protein
MLRKSRGEKPVDSFQELQEQEEQRIAARQSGEEDTGPDPYLDESGAVMADLIYLLNTAKVVSTDPLTPQS